MMRPFLHREKYTAAASFYRGLNTAFLGLRSFPCIYNQLKFVLFKTRDISLLLKLFLSIYSYCWNICGKFNIVQSRPPESRAAVYRICCTLPRYREYLGRPVSAGLHITFFRKTSFKVDPPFRRAVLWNLISTAQKYHYSLCIIVWAE